MTSIQHTVDELRLTLTEYIEAAYHIADPFMVEQRRTLLGAEGGIFQVPFIESTPRYRAAQRYEEMTSIPSAAQEAFAELARGESEKAVIFNPPYTHQADAIREVLTRGRNLMVMTGTGSGKTESFLLPILGKLAIEAKTNPRSFNRHNAVRAFILYPMNALVNDQLGRLRLLFGDPRTVRLFEGWAGRPARFARYTSRTPYAGVRSRQKDAKRLSSIGDFFAEIEDKARSYQRDPQGDGEERRAYDLFCELHARGKWPAKESVSDWFGKDRTHWQDRNNRFRRAILRPHDAELLTRHEVQESPPDLLITNYSMLEYMMVRPIERPIFDRTKQWLQDSPEEKVVLVMDEAHLYRGAQGAEVGLLIRRLTERLGIGPERLQVICATASFNNTDAAGHFGAQLTGAPEESFTPIRGTLALRSPADFGTRADADVLARVDLRQFYEPEPEAQAAAIAPLLEYRAVPFEGDVERALFEALREFAPLNRLVNETMKQAVRLADLGTLIFPHMERSHADTAVSALLALGSRARESVGAAGLLPCRVHTFFRGLPGLWACMDPNCSEITSSRRGGPAGKMYAQPRERCGCGAMVLEYFTCRHCGTSYSRAYTSNVADPRYTWANPGTRVQTEAGQLEALHALDLLLEEPSAESAGRAAYFDLVTGRIDPPDPGERYRVVHLPPAAAGLPPEEHGTMRAASPGQFTPCACCDQQHMFGLSSVQDHQTKGDQPFQALVATQLKIQPPGPQPGTDFAPLRGRKVLVFSDSRQMAARLAPTLQNYSLNDTVRALVPAGFKLLSGAPQIGENLSLDQAFLGVICAAHKFRVRVRPELEAGEALPSMVGVPHGQLPTGPHLFALLSATCPVNLMRSIVNALCNSNLGVEPLAIASICERSDITAHLHRLPQLPGLAATAEEKAAVARMWLRCWARGPGIWFNQMPPEWWATAVRAHKGDFDPMDRVIVGKEARRVFKKDWLPQVLKLFTQKLPDGGTRALAATMSLHVGGNWRRCSTCTSVHRPIPQLATCVDCGAETVADFDPDADAVFRARKNYYREPVRRALESSEPNLLSLIAAEHTAQLNAAQPDDAFSKAEDHELRFQDIDLGWRDTDASEPAIDVLSSTTTMEVGIDIGALSGAALRNMPPGRANYQQRSGRAGRRGNAVATVVAFGSSDSHDDHYFVSPEEMITGPVSDPRLTLENADIARRHLRAFVLQRYHEARIPGVDPQADPNLFSVLGTVPDFRNGTALLNREDLFGWLLENVVELQDAARRWLPAELPQAARQALIDGLATDVMRAVDDAIDYVGPETAQEDPEADPGEADENGDNEGVAAAPEANGGENNAMEVTDEDADPTTEKLLDRLLYRGALPRYAFPTDVAPFYVFNRALSTPFRPKMEFAPAQGLNIALSQYAPNKQIWLQNKQYTSKAIYSPFKGERRKAWRGRKLYFECLHCGHAKTEQFVQERRGETRRCEACHTDESFGPARSWFRPPGFAHPVHLAPSSTPEELSETAYATRAKLIMSAPAIAWTNVSERLRVYPSREHLLISNSGPDESGYIYCVSCGSIESEKDPQVNLYQAHPRPYPAAEGELCDGKVVARNVVLGTDFIADVCLFSLRLEAPFRLRPGNDETATALRTVCEALAKAACRLLEIEAGEILAEYRPAVTNDGANGLEAEIFLYDTLAGGAGFSPQMADRAHELFELALHILAECPEGCDTSCYRCLRSFKNKFEHRLLDRRIGAQLLRHVLEGGYPPYAPERVATSTDLLVHDLTRQLSDNYEVMKGETRFIGGRDAIIPIVVRRRSNGEEGWIVLSSPIAADTPVSADLQGLAEGEAARLICIDDLVVRRHLPGATATVARRAP
jgi:ATP-dependent helicase YprA (DUF1998 family)